LRRLLLVAGQEFGICKIDFNAILSLRLEKSFGIWSRECIQGYTSAETGMDRFIAWNKGEFTEHAAALAERDTPSSRVLVTLTVAAIDVDSSGYQLVWQDGKLVGFVTSCGDGHTISQSLAMAKVDLRGRRSGDATDPAHRRARGDGRGDRPLTSRPEENRDALLTPMTPHYSALSLLKDGLTGQKGWAKAWESPEPKPRYDMVIVDGGGHGLCPRHRHRLALGRPLRRAAVRPAGCRSLPR